jgi:hypothetical protein
MHFVLRLRLPERSGLSVTQILAPVTLTWNQSDSMCASGQSSLKQLLAAQSYPQSITVSNEFSAVRYSWEE